MGFSYEQRGFTRVPFEERPSVTLTSEGGRVITGNLVDLSMTGAMVECSEPFDADEVCVILIKVNDDMTLEMRGTVARVDSDSLGVMFTGISGDSYEALHELLVDNAEDKDAVRNEVFERAHLAPDLY